MTRARLPPSLTPTVDQTLSPHLLYLLTNYSVFKDPRPTAGSFRQPQSPKARDLLDSRPNLFHHLVFIFFLTTLGPPASLLEILFF